MNNPEWLVIVNPNAGAGRCRLEWDEIDRLLRSAGISFRAVFTTRRLHAMILSRRGIKEGYRKMVAVGGDGTLNEVINGVFGQKEVPTREITIGMIPVGTGNDWSRMFGIPPDYPEAINILNRQHTFIQDAGRVIFSRSGKVNKRYFINIAGIGFDALVTRKTNKLKENGRSNKIVYLLNIFTGLFDYQSFNAKLEVDGKAFNHDIFSMSIGICKYNGGGMVPLPNAVPDDGQFDLTIIKRMGRFNILRSLPRLYNGSILSHPKVLALTGNRIRISSEETVHLETDGENLGHTPFEFEIIPASLTVITGLKKP
jgi:YegS/Rv2252/BmrU family lipid kinase